VAGNGTIGQRLADGVALQGDMELVGVADLAPTLAIRALKEKGMPYKLYLVEGADKSKFDALGIPVAGTFDELIHSVDVMLDSSPGGIGAKKIAIKSGGQGHLQGGVKNSVADVFFHGYAILKKASARIIKAHELQHHGPHRR
jgi:glyceraldehyde-3-phosphate dehydrogenase (NAD(P))